MTSRNRVAPAVVGTVPAVMSRLKGIVAHFYADIGGLTGARLVLARYSVDGSMGVATWHKPKQRVWICVWANGPSSGHRAFLTEADTIVFHNRKVKTIESKERNAHRSGPSKGDTTAG